LIQHRADEPFTRWTHQQGKPRRRQIRQTPQHTYQILTKRIERAEWRVPVPPLPIVWLGVSVENQPAGVLMVRDRIRPDAMALVTELVSLGVTPAMLTGDREETARSVADELGITLWKSGCSPQGKADQLLAWTAAGYRTAMAGDGINDAPALAVASASVAMGAGSDIAKETAGIILLSPSLEGILRSIRLSRAILRTIRQNLFFAFAYNLLGVPIAAGALYPWTGLAFSPMIAAVAMSLSSVSVIANSLRLRKGRLCHLQLEAVNPAYGQMPPYS
jgi:cation transport ATPase